MSTAGTKASADPSTALGMTTPREALEQGLVAWLNERFAPDGPLIHADTLLFSGGLLDSLRILELIAWTERAIGREIDDGDIVCLLPDGGWKYLSTEAWATDLETAEKGVAESLWW